MRIGLDFDNTIVSYDTLFHSVAVEQSLIPVDLPKSKIAVREHLKQAGRERRWTELQGYVYGFRMDEAVAYPGVIDFITSVCNRGFSIVIISHKTKHPVIGPKYDLHQAARDWIKSTLHDKTKQLFSFENIFFKPTQIQKVSQIAKSSCDYFIDDLPEILLMTDFPDSCKPVLFDPESIHHPETINTKFRSWPDITKFFEHL